MRYLICVLVLILSCSSGKEVLLVQNFDKNEELIFSYSEIKIKPDDILRIKVSTKSPELQNLFNLDNSQSANSIESYQINGFKFNQDGFINIPLLNKVYVEGMSAYEISVLIQKNLSSEGLLMNSVVDVKLVNAYFTVLGEVNNPGRYHFLENNMNILQALGAAGDLTINGKRNDIKILRVHKEKIKTAIIDMTSSDFLTSSNFQIMPGDVIIVNPNNARVKNAGIIGNFGNLLSVLSFILSSIILITSTN